MLEINESPFGLMVRAIHREKRNAKLFSLLAERFRPFNERLAVVFDDIAVEEDLTRAKLIHWFESRFGFLPPEQNPTEDELFWLTGEDHFFVTNEDVSERLLWQAFRDEMDSYLFFKEASLQTEDPNVHDLYEKVAAYELSHAHALQDLTQ